MKITRRTQLLVVALALCFTTMIGSTFAWFTDSVQSANNVITTGNLDIKLEYKTKTNDAYTEVTSTTPLFDNNAKWEPGHTKVAYLKITNAGNLALKYNLNINIADETTGTNVAGDTLKLSDHLMFKVVESDSEISYTNRADAMSAAGTELGLKAYNGEKKSMTTKGEEDYVALIVYMPETVGNEANHNGTNIPSLTLGVKLDAKQKVSEADGFDNTYDENLKETILVDTEAKLSSAYAAAKSGDVIRLSADIPLNNTLVFNKNVAVTLDLGGNTISTSSLGTLLKISDGIVTIKNGKIKNVKDQATETQYSVYLDGNAVANITDVEIETSGTGIFMTGNSKITELNAKVNSYMNANGYCAFDAVSLDGNARIDKITGGEYTSKISEKYIEEWKTTHSYSGIDSYTIRLNSAGADIGEISGGTFLGVIDKANNGTSIHVNAGTLEKISGGYFGFYKWGLTAPDRMLFVFSSNSGAIGPIVGGTFERGVWDPGFGCDFENIVQKSGCNVVDTGETVEAKAQFSTSVKTYTLNVVKVVEQ